MSVCWMAPYKIVYLRLILIYITMARYLDPKNDEIISQKKYLLFVLFQKKRIFTVKK